MPRSRAEIKLSIWWQSSNYTTANDFALSLEYTSSGGTLTSLPNNGSVILPVPTYNSNSNYGALSIVRIIELSGQLNNVNANVSIQRTGTTTGNFDLYWALSANQASGSF